MVKYSPRDIATFGPPDILAAAGAVILAWNRCEHTMHQLLSVTSMPKGSGSAIYFNTSNAGRLEVLRAVSSLYDEPIPSLVAEFATQAAICIENRNLVAHAMLFVDYMTFTGMMLRKAKSGKSDKYNNFPVDEEGLLQIANGCQNLCDFGEQILGFILRLPGRPLENTQKQNALPEKPPRPSKLNPRN